MRAKIAVYTKCLPLIGRDILQFLFPSPMFFSALLLASSAVASVRAAYPAGVVATGTQGTTNPPAPTMPTTINQKSMARLLSINSIDDFCLFAPPTGPSNIADTEVYRISPHKQFWLIRPPRRKRSLGVRCRATTRESSRTVLLLACPS
jgi:hypothetical protein